MKHFSYAHCLLALIAGFAVFHTALAQTSSDPNEGARLAPGPLHSYDFSWWGKAGRTYFIQESEDLLDWIYVRTVIESGAGDVIRWGLTSTADKFFLRLRYSDFPTTDPFNADFDGDKVGNQRELSQGTDPLHWSDSGNGIPDDWELFHFDSVGVDPAADPDGDDYSNLAEFSEGTDPRDFYNGVTPVLSVVSGGNQSGLRSSYLAAPLIVQVADAGSLPLANVRLIFNAGGGARLGTSDAGGSPLTPTLLLRTGEDGRATVYCYTPPVAGVFPIAVDGTAPGATLSLFVSETATDGVVQAPSAASNVVESWSGPKTMVWTWKDNSDNEEEFIIERQNAAGVWVEIGRVGPNETSFTYTIPD